MAVFTVAAALAICVGVVAYSVRSLLVSDASGHTYVAALAYLLGSGLVVYLIRSKHIAGATRLFVAMTWFAGGFFLLLEGPGTGHVGIFFIAVVVAGLLNGSRWALAYGLGSALLLVCAHFAMESGLLKAEPTDGPAWTHQTPQLIIVGVLVSVLVRGLHRALAQLQASRNALADSEHQLSTLVETLPDGILLFGADGRCELANPAAARMLGRPATEVVGGGMDHTGLIDSDGFDPATFADGVYTRELTTGEGRRRVLEVNGHRLERTDGTAAFEMVLRDVTARVEAEESMREAESRLRRSQRTEALGRLAGGVAHDFNNLLTVMLGNSQLIAREKGLSPTVRERAEQIEQVTLKAGAITQQLLSFGRKPEGERKNVDVRQVLEGLRRMAERLLGEHVKLVINHSGAAVVSIDPVQLEQVIVNLVVNAQDACLDGGRLTISVASCQMDEGAAATAGVAPGRWVRMRFEDTGSGMSSDVAARVFEPFFSTKSEERGTGLGLSTVQLIIQSAGGTIGVDSEVGKGTVFTLLLPQVDESAQAPGARPRSSVEDVQAHATVCVVDDDAAIRDFVAGTLAARGYVVVSASDEDSATRELASRGLHPDLLVTDVVLEEADGVQLAKALGRAYPGLRVLYMSGYPGQVLERRELSTSPVDLLAKPFGVDTLLYRVQAALGESPARA